MVKEIRVSLVAGVCGIASQSVGLITLLVAVSRAPWFSWTENYLSILGVRDSATTLFNSGLILAGIFSLVFAIGLGKSLLLGRWQGRLGMGSLILASVAFSAIGIFPRTIGLPHHLASLAFFAFVTVAIFLIGVHVIATSSKIWGVLSIIAVVLIVVFRLLPWPWPGVAIPQLLTTLPWSLWTTAFSIKLLMSPSLTARVSPD